MPFDLDRTFQEVFVEPRLLKRQILEILPHVKSRSQHSIPTLTFLAIQAKSEQTSNSLESQEASDSISDDDWSSTDSGPDDPDAAEHSCRAFDFTDADDPNLQLTLIKTEDEMGARTMKRYLAVSYCWPSPEDNALREGFLDLPVTILESSGVCRPSRASPHIIRRAVRHAARLRLKYIWLDQESINQADPDEKEAAVQYMDTVYSSSSDVLSLLDVHVDSQDHIDLLESLHEYNRGGVGSRFNSMRRHLAGLRGSPELANALTEILLKFATARWFSRAWIMQERLCSGDLSSTELWATCPPNLKSQTTGEVCLIVNDQLGDAKEVVHHLRQNGTTAAAVVNMSESGSVDGTDGCPKKKVEAEQYDSEECKQAATKLEAAIGRFEESCSLVSPATERRRITYSVRSFYGLLQCTHILSPLGCLYPSDKLAMLSNICSWEKRLDTREIVKHEWSYSLCIWLLAIMNGDASFFCHEESCKTNKDAEYATWAPQATTKLDSMLCSGLIDFVSMSLSDDGLKAQGWLFRTERYIDLSKLNPIIDEIDRSVPQVEKGQWVDYDFEQVLVEDKVTKLQEFFWALLLELRSIGEDECVNLIWEAAKLRYSGGFYGRSLQTIPIDSFDTIVEVETGRFIGCFDHLGIPKKYENDEEYLTWGPIAPSAIKYLRQNCDHCRSKWKIRKKTEKGEPKQKPSHALLGQEEQLEGIAWIRDVIQKDGGLAIGRIVHGKLLLGTSSEFKQPKAPNSAATLAILGFPEREQQTHVFTMHRQVRKYKKGDGKALYLVHPFDVWLKDAPDHTDAPLCWNATVRQDGGIDTMRSGNALFDIGKIERTEHLLSWPEVYNQASWT